MRCFTPSTTGFGRFRSRLSAIFVVAADLSPDHGSMCGVPLPPGTEALRKRHRMRRESTDASLKGYVRDFDDCKQAAG
jgi:hypothetical protein